MEPTDAQIQFVNDICDELYLDKPEEFTKESYSEFISEYKDQMYNSRRGRNIYNDMNYIYWN